MKIDASMQGCDPADAAALTAALEHDGFDGAFSVETSHDPFLTIALASTSTSLIDLGTSVAIAFARNPMTVAILGSDLHRVTGGRFILGLGSQVKPHITNRFAMPWSRPALRMREFIAAVRSIWSCWNDGTPLKFEGEFYRHTIMTPMFNPGPSPVGNPRIFLGAVGTRMVTVAGQAADGLVAHGFSTAQYLRDVTVPCVVHALEESGRSRDDFEIGMPVFIVTGRTPEETAASEAATRRQLAFYGSTPAYRPVLEHHDWGALGEKLNVMSKRGEWHEMTESITDEVLAEFAVIASPDRVAAEVTRRYDGLLDRVQVTVVGPGESLWPSVVRDFHAAAPAQRQAIRL